MRDKNEGTYVPGGEKGRHLPVTTRIVQKIAEGKTPYQVLLLTTVVDLESKER